jgi:hypothetical protein
MPCSRCKHHYHYHHRRHPRELNQGRLLRIRNKISYTFQAVLITNQILTRCVPRGSFPAIKLPLHEADLLSLMQSLRKHGGSFKFILLLEDKVLN